MQWSKQEQAEHRAELVAALRSGQYQQVRSLLHQQGEALTGFCCLGVACEISGLGQWEDADEPNPDGSSRMKYVIDLGNGEEESAESYLPGPVREYFGFRSTMASFEPIQGLVDPAGHEYKTLYRMNDEEESFKRIANLIEEEPKGLVGEPEYIEPMKY